jgi:hypothetical protein
VIAAAAGLPALGRGWSLRERLARAGLELDASGFRGHLAGTAVALRVESADCVRLERRLEGAAGGLAALERGATLPGNARLALDARGLLLVADAHLEDDDDAAEVLRAAVAALAPDAPGAARPPVGAGERAPRLELDHVTRGLRERPPAGEDVVQREDGWEIRPRLHGVVFPVRATLLEGALHLRSPVLEGLPDGCAAAVADLALRLNARLRHARLALRGGRLDAEALLDAGLVRGPRIAAAARALAAATSVARRPLSILTASPDVAQGYARIFLSA